jgi:uncharacterized cupin superfamily protein
MVENGRVDPSVSRLKRIAQGLGVTIVDLFRNESEQDVVIRKHNRSRAEFRRSKTVIEILVPSIPDKQMDARLAIIHPGGSSEGDYHHPGEEFGLVLNGILELSIDGVKHRLMQGDSFYFRSIQNHRFRNPGDEDTLVVWVNHPPSW